ncbi:hypothetical protein D3C79_953360 [compost metagenome]
MLLSSPLARANLTYSEESCSSISERTSRINSGSMMEESDTAGRIKCLMPSQVKKPDSQPSRL